MKQPPDEAMIRYEELRRARPDLFENPPGTPLEILSEPPADGGPFGVAYTDPYLTLLRDPVRFANGHVAGYLRVVHTAGLAGAAILPVYQGRIVLLRIFRHATRQWHWEIPRGFCDPGETAEDTARRELIEELGVAAERIEPIGRIHTDTGINATSASLFWAALGGPANPPGEEGVEQAVGFTPSEIAEMQERGTITDSFTMAALLNARQRQLPPFR